MQTTIGTKIRERRVKLGLTQDELANKLGYTDRSTISKIESGANELTYSGIFSFAEALGTTPAELMGQSSAKPQSNTIQLKIRKPPKPKTADLCSVVKITPEAEMKLRELRYLTGLSMRQIASQLIVQAAAVVELVEE